MPHFAPFFVLFACQEPFGTDRHVLEGDRVAAIGRAVEAGGTRADAALVIDGKTWTDTPVDLRWYALPDGTDVAALDADSVPLAVGPRPLLDGADAYALIAVFPSGEERRAFFDAATGALPAPEFTLAAPEGLTVADAEAATLARDARLALADAPIDTVAVGGFARIGAAFDPAPPAAPRLRWMGAGGGTFFELDDARTDWAAGALVLDDDEVVTREARDAGVEPILALALGDGAASWAPLDVFVGDRPSGLPVGGRWLAGPVTASPGWWRVTLQADDAEPIGLSIVEGAPLDALPAEDPFGTEALACDAVIGPFEPRWLIDGRCTRAALDGASVVVEVR